MLISFKDRIFNECKDKHEACKEIQEVKIFNWRKDFL